MDFSNWPVWAALIALLLTNQYTLRFLNRVLVTLGLASVKREETEIDHRKWMERQAEWAADKAFDILEGTIKDFQEQSQRRDKTMIDMIAELHKNTLTIGEQVSAVKLLAQKIIRMEEQLHQIDTRWWETRSQQASD